MTSPYFRGRDKKSMMFTICCKEVNGSKIHKKTVEIIYGCPIDGRSTVFATVDKRGAQPILGTTAEV